MKQEVVKYLQCKEGTSLSWTGVIVGGYFDSVYDIPGVFGVSLRAKTLTVYDGDEEVFEVTTMEQIGRTIAAVLSDDHLEETINKYVHINSFTMSQNQIFKSSKMSPGMLSTLNMERKRTSMMLDKRSGGLTPERPNLPAGYVGGHHGNDARLWRILFIFQEKTIVECKTWFARGEY